MKIKFIILLSIVYSCMAGCDNEHMDKPEYDAPEGMCAVEFVLPGMIGEPLSETSKKNSRMGNAPDDEVDGNTLSDKKIINLPDGTTLWIKAKEIVDNEPHEVISSYVVRNISGTETGQQMLYPCTVDAEGNVIEETSIPMFLKIGSIYEFYAVSPARAFVEGTDNALYVNNKEYVISSDKRYEQTKPKQVEITDKEGAVQIVEMNTLINQTAQLEFTIYAEDNDPNIYSLDVLPQGVEISGIQRLYDFKMNTNAEPWNWSWNDTLKVMIGQNDEKVIVRKLNETDNSFIMKNPDGSLYVKCPILPTDAYSSSIIVLFNLEVNGNPTQFEFMLNQKIFRSAYTYHYKGKLSIENGVAVMTWQYVSWDKDAPVIPN